jgi:hypothetical protein
MLNTCILYFIKIWHNTNGPFGVKPIIRQSELRTYTKVVSFKENSLENSIFIGHASNPS